MKDVEALMIQAQPPGPGMADQIEPAARQMLNKLVHHVRTYSADRGRVRKLVTFQARHPKSGDPTPRDISTVAWNDRPEIELYLTHRDRALELDKLIGLAKGKLHDIDMEPLALQNCLASLNGLEEKYLKHVASMEKILESLSKEQIHREQIMAKIAADGAKLAQAASQHQDKMELAREVTRVPTADDLRAKLAAKYGVPVEEVDKILKAKNAQLIIGDEDEGPDATA